MVHYLNEELRWRILSLKQNAQWSNRRIAVNLNISPGTVSKCVKRFEDTGHVKDRIRSGRPRVTDDVDNQTMVVEANRKPTSSLSDLQLHLRMTRHHNISSRTIARRLHDAGLQSRKPAHFPVLSPNNQDNRLEWARLHARWNLHHWEQVIFSDESRFCVRFIDGRLRVWRPRGERYNPQYIEQVDRYGGGSVMVWAAISYNQKSNLVIIPGTLNATRYRDTILAPVAMPFGLAAVGRGFIFQDDNAPCHRARIVNDFWENHNECLHMWWPSKSPDLNIIEHVWDMLGRRVRSIDPPVNTARDLAIALPAEWDQILQTDIQKLYRSLRSRCQACVQNNGGPTRY